MENKNFTHLHVHTGYSFLDGMCKIEDLVAKAKELGMSALAITDHNHCGGTYEFQTKCLEAGLKPILGYEAYYNPDIDSIAKSPEERRETAATKALADKAITSVEYDIIVGGKKNAKISKKSVEEKLSPYMPDLKQYHVIFLAMDQTGWRNLIKLQSESAARCTYKGKFTCNDELIEKYNEGLICTTACIASRIARYINKNNDYKKAEELLVKWGSIFGDRLYLEMQPLYHVDQIRANAFFISMSKKYGYPLIVTNDVHYISKEDHDDHDTFLCIGTGTKKSEYGPNHMVYSNEFWFRSYDEMVENLENQLQLDKMNEKLLPDEYIDICKEALEETNRLAARISSSIEIGSKTPLIPQVKLPEGETPEEVLTKRCFKALYRLAKTDEYVKENLRLYEKRLRTELDVINPKGFASYLLVVDEYVSWANNNSCYTDFGRGSAAGCLCLYLLGVTKLVDPIKNGLIFERFLTKDRTLAPDVDIDFSYEKRPMLLKHLSEFYGPECVCHIGTYTASGVKSGIKDVCRVLEISFAESNEISKQLDEINDTPQPKFKDYDNLKNNENPGDIERWKKFDALEKKYCNIFRLARKFEGLKRNFGVHASGILAMPIPITDMIPTRVIDGESVCLYTGPEVEELNLIKLDVLGLKTIDLVQKTLESVNPEWDFNSFSKSLDLEDENVYNMLCKKKTDAVFQLESDMFKGIIADVKPNCLADITAITSLGRPGPLANGMPQQYARRKNGEEDPVPLLRGMDDILEETYGEIIYQESVMAIGVRAFGFNGNQSDSILRKIIGKKKKDKLEMLRRMVKYGKINTEGPEGWHDNPELPWYDPDGKQYGDEIPGGLKKGFSEKEIDEFWEKLVEFASYCFNKSHACSYSVLSYATAYLKYYYPTEFFAAVLSIQSDDKIDKYSQVCHNEGIKIITPDINVSCRDFTPNAKEKTIYYGLSSIKGVGEKAIEEIIAARPFSSLEDIFEKLPKRIFNKRVALALAKSGALDAFDDNKNRKAIINRIFEIRKDKCERELEETYDTQCCIDYEKEILSAPITYKPWWDTVKPGKKIEEGAAIMSVNERVDKNGNAMAFLKLNINSCEIEGIIFSSVYKKCIGVFDSGINKLKIANVVGKKDDKGKLIITSASIIEDPYEGEPMK